MLFTDEETQTSFHKLPTQKQYDFLNLEELCAQMGYPLAVRTDSSGTLEIFIRINGEPHVSSFED